MKKLNKYIDKIFKKILEVEFVKDNYKIIQKSLIIIWFVFVIKLFLFWVRISSWWWWFISFSIVPTFHYHWTNAWIISIILLILFLYFLFKISEKKSNLKKIKITFLIFILWIFSNQIFLLFSPDFKFYLTSVTKQYKNKDWTINDLDKYIKLVNKYCAYNWLFNYKLMWRYSMCASNDKFEGDLKTVEEYIKVLESANKNNFDFLYSLTIEWLFRSELVEEVIEKYNDDTFYGYLIDKKWSNVDFLDFILKNNKNVEISKLIEEIKFMLQEYNLNKIKMDQYEIEDFWEDFDNYTLFELRKINTINQKLF